MCPSVVGACCPLIFRNEGEAFVLRLEVPGMEKEDFDIRYDNRKLIISGDKRRESSRSEEGFIYHECAYGRFRRILALPDEVDEFTSQSQL